MPIRTDGVDGALKTILRLLDANSNRAREGIRTAEDFIRFEIQNKPWAERLRQLRHRITQQLESQIEGGSDSILASRRVKLDQGHPDKQGQLQGLVIAKVAENSTDTGQETSLQVAVRGLKRAQEATRVLEEFSRAKSGEAAKAFSQIRFELYEIEQWLARGSEVACLLEKACLYVLMSQSNCALGLEQTALAAIKGGAGVIQLREKELEDKELFDRAFLLRKICTAHGVVFVVNDRADIALAVGADGVHLGQTDLCPDAVRPWVGEHFLIGCSTHCEEDAKRASAAGADYIAIGAMFETATKSGTVSAGPAAARAVLDLDLSIPVFAIGGINRDRIGQLKNAGISRVAVSSAVISAPDPEMAAREMIEALRG